MKTINVKVKKVKNGYLIPPIPALDKQGKDEITLEIRIKNTPLKKADEKSYKELRDEAIWERYLEKEKRKVPSRISAEELDKFSKKYGLEDINSIDDILRRLKKK